MCGLRSYSRGDGVYDTNQRLEFELDEYGQRLFVGSSDEGLVRNYDVTSERLEGTLNIFNDNLSSRRFEEVHSDTDDDYDETYNSFSVGANSRKVATYPSAGCLQLHGMTTSN